MSFRIGLSLAVFTALLAGGLLICLTLDVISSGAVTYAILGLILLAQAGAGFLLIRGRNRFLDLAEAPEVKDFQRARTEFEEYQHEIRRELDVEATRLDQMSRKLSDRYRVIHEWLDTPELIDVNEHPADFTEPFAGKNPRSRIVQRDREVQKILDRQGEVIYERIRKNEYAPQGQFDPRLFRDDMMSLVTQIALVYQPDLKNPLLQTSPEQLARALNRIGLHLLVVMDQLPLDLKSYNIQQTYETVRRAVKAYGHYVKASPYVSWASRGLFMSRMATSLNPVTLGIWWGASELGKFGARKIAGRIIDHQAIGLLQSLIRVVGYEVAGIYGGDFRHRDANWCYGVEVTHMAAALPNSREGLRAAMKEIARLELRNEYDRLALFRALAAGKTISRNREHVEMLTEDERRQILTYLEKAFQETAHGRTSAEAESWRKGVQEHLGLQFSRGEKPKQDDATRHRTKLAAQDREILQALVAFLLTIKTLDTTETNELLKTTELTRWVSFTLSEKELQEELDSLLANPRGPQLTQLVPPDLDPKDPRVDQFLRLLARWNAEISPLMPEAEEVMVELALYYRRDAHLAEEFQLAAFKQRMLREYPDQRELVTGYPPASCRAIFYLQSANATFGLPERIYGKPSVHWIDEESLLQSDLPAESELALMVMPERILLVEQGPLNHLPQLIWQSNSTTQLFNRSGVMTASAEISGGETLLDTPELRVESIALDAPMTARFQNYFEPLLDRLPCES